MVAGKAGHRGARVVRPIATLSAGRPGRSPTCRRTDAANVLATTRVRLAGSYDGAARAKVGRPSRRRRNGVVVMHRIRKTPAVRIGIALALLLPALLLAPARPAQATVHGPCGEAESLPGPGHYSGGC